MKLLRRIANSNKRLKYKFGALVTCQPKLWKAWYRESAINNFLCTLRHLQLACSYFWKSL